MRRALCVAVMVIAVCATPGSSWAAPPTLQGVAFDQATKTLAVTWSLPAGEQGKVLEATPSDLVDADGYFVNGQHNGHRGDDVIYELLDPNASSWTQQYPNITSGYTYFVHVGVVDTNCVPPCQVQWSAIGTFEVNQPAAPPPPPAPKCKVPAVIGKTLTQAKARIRAAHCAVGRVKRIRSKKRNGTVTRESPSAGKMLAAGSKVNLWVSRGKR